MPTGSSDYWHHCRPSLLELGAAMATREHPGEQPKVVTDQFLNVDARVEGVTLENSPFWTTSFRGCRNLVIDRVSITTPCGGFAVAPNTDGFNVGFTDGALITNSYVLAARSSFDESRRRRGRDADSPRRRVAATFGLDRRAHRYETATTACRFLGSTT